MLDVTEFLVGRDASGGSAEAFRFVPETKVDVSALTTTRKGTTSRVGVVAEIATAFLDADSGDTGGQKQYCNECSHTSSCG